MIKNIGNTRAQKVKTSFIIGSILFILVSALGIYFEIFVVLALGFIPPILYYSIFEFEKLFYFSVFLTPFSISLQDLFPQIPFDIALFSELFMVWLLFLLIFKSVKSNIFPARIFVHPVSIAVILYLLWTFIGCFTSSMPLVSIKYLLAKLWFIVPLYFFPIVLFKDIKQINKFYYLYIIPFLIVIIYTIKNHLSFGFFDKQAAHFVMRPFYNDHTSYGAILAMYIPIIAGLFFLAKNQVTKRVILLGLLSVFLTALVLSYTRAAWISVIAAVILWGLMELKIKLSTLVLLGGLCIIVLFSFRVEIMDKLGKNKQDSSAELSEHVKSISNIATDASNKERINRWNSAMKMFAEKPISGWGPGTYMFQYAPFQMADDKTIISTNFGEVGNAHSEYIGPLAELGVPGLITVLLIIITVLHTAFKLYYQSKNKLTRKLVMMSLLSLVTYYVHGLLNNYLDTDKASVPFWGMTAIIVSLDLFQNHSPESKNPQLGGAEER